MATLICSSLAAATRAAHERFPTTAEAVFPVYKPNPTLLSFAISPRRLASPLSALRPPQLPTLSFVPKFAPAEASVIETEQESNVPEQSEALVVAETPNEDPLREEVFAVVMVGSRQYIVFPGRFIYTQRLKDANVSDQVILNKVLLVGTKTRTYIGKPVVTNAVVHAVVEEQGLDKKVVVFKYKKKKNYRRNIGHRQPHTRIRILGISGYQDYPASTL